MKQTSLFLLVALLGFVACKKDPDPVLPPSETPPQQQLPNPLPAKARVAQLLWTDTDHETMTYNANGQVSKLTSQWQYVQGDPSKIRSIVYDFHYDSQQRPNLLSTSDGFRIQYTYHDTLVERTQELLPSGTMLTEATYLYDTKFRIVREVRRRTNWPGDSIQVIKYELGYDNQGNLNKVEEFDLVGTDEYELRMTTEYSDFDNKINPTSWQLRYPYLPQVRWQMNNPRKEIRRQPTGETVVITTTYDYNSKDLPVVKRTIHPAEGATTMHYLY